MLYLAIFAILIFLLALALFFYARRLRVDAGLPAGEVVYSDTGAWETVEKPLLSRRYGLVGKPDYLVRVTQDGRQLTVPVEVKSRTRPRTTPESHILQLAAYCLLVEDIFKQRPPYGLLHYADATLQIPFDEELRRAVLDTAEEIRLARKAPDVHRQHEYPSRCRGCGYRHGCGQEALTG